MNEELRKKLEAALSAKGLDKELAKSTFIKIEKEEEIEGVVTELQKLQKPQPKPQSLDDFLKDNPEAKSDFDKKITAGIETYKKNQKKKNPKQDPSNPGDNEDDQEWKNEINSLKEAIEALKTEKTAASKKSEAEKLWSKSNLPKGIKDSEVWFKRIIDLDSETSFEDQIKAAEKDLADVKQTVIDETIGSEGFPDTHLDEEPTDAMIESITG
ncbi:MAG: hypothetical protein MK105_15150 [Crocinitomicaceae bacterium]|nr:hypothetical protein [Crocinitomicaceae bacterium]